MLFKLLLLISSLISLNSYAIEPVTDLSAVEAQSPVIELHWEESTSPVGIKNYIVFRDGVEIATPLETMYVDKKDIGFLTKYTYLVKAVDINGLVGGAVEVSITTPDKEIVVPPVVIDPIPLPTHPPGLVARLKIRWFSYTQWINRILDWWKE